MFCKNCGNELNEGVQFCKNCGTQAGVVSDNKVYMQEKTPVSPVEKRSSNALWVFVVLGVVLLVGAGAGLYFFMSGSEQQEQVGNEQIPVSKSVEKEVSKEVANQMTMITSGGEIHIRLEGSGEVTVDWGDGSQPEMKSLPPDSRELFRHLYTSSTNHTITIKGKNITQLDCQYSELTSLDVSANSALTELQCSSNKLTGLNVGKNTALKRLYCYNNKLTGLDVSKNTALELLECDDNQFSDDALNALFRSLHSKYMSDKIISIAKNPGTGSCDKEIAENKGWEVILNRYEE